MSKRFAAGCDEVFDGTDYYTVTYNSSDEMGEDGVYYTLSNYNNETENTHIKRYTNDINENNKIHPMVETRNGNDNFNLTNPPVIIVGQEYDLILYRPMPYPYLDIINSLEVELPDKVFELFNHFITSKNITINVSAVANTDGILQSFVKIDNTPVGPFNIYKTRRVTASGCQDKEFILSKNESYKITACIERTFTINVFSSLTGKYLTNLSKSTNNYPHKPTIERIVRNGAVFVRVTTNVPAHGNIYFNGGAEPAYTYVTSRIAPYTAEIKIDKVGAYTANIISEVIIEGQHYYAYGELSDTLIIETQNVDCTLTFNEYTGVISCVPDIEGSVEKFTLQKQNGSEWINVSENTIGEFHITEGGTYKIIPTFGIFYTGTVFPESITVKTTLDTPVAYSDPAFPSQLGFDEVENANIYDVYRVSEDGEDELVASISENNIVSRIMRKEKMFIVIPNDEVRNV